MTTILLRICFSILVFISAFSSQVTCASLIETEVYWPNDRLLTVDTRTGLEWLDLETTTDGFSIYQALVSPWVTELGFRVANAHEVDSLLESAGLGTDVFDPNQSAPEAVSWASLVPERNKDADDAYDQLISLLGYTAWIHTPISAIVEVNGLFLGMSDNEGLGLFTSSSSGFKSISSTHLSYDTRWNGFDYTGSDENYGVFLVRGRASLPVPAPNPASLILLGALALFLTYNRRRVSENSLLGTVEI